MNTSLFVFILVVLIFSITGSAIALSWYLKKIHPREDAITGSLKDSVEPDAAMKRWRTLAISWPLLCILLSVIILYQSFQGMEKRLPGDAAFTLIPLVFFAVGMFMGRGILKRRRYATVLTTATVTSTGRVLRPGKRNYFPEYEFRVGEITYHVKEKAGYSVCFVSEGKQVELYYAPENPRVFYVPIMQKHDKRMSVLLCTVGILWPLFGFFAPQIRQLFWFLY